MSKSKFLIKEVEDKGGRFKRVVASDEQGEHLTLSVWPDYPHYDDVVVGNFVEGVIRESRDGKYKNLVSELQKPNFMNNPSQSRGIAGAMQRKQSSITASQDRKEQSIQKAQERSEKMWAKRSAAELVAFHPSFKETPKEKVKEEVEKLYKEIMEIGGEPF